MEASPPTSPLLGLLLRLVYQHYSRHIEAALREAAEESGISDLTVWPGVLDLDRHPAPCRPGVVEHHLDVRFLVVAPAGAEPVVSTESLDVRWFGWDALPNGIESTIVRMVAAGRARLGV